MKKVQVKKGDAPLGRDDAGVTEMPSVGALARLWDLTPVFNTL